MKNLLKTTFALLCLLFVFAFYSFREVRVHNGRLKMSIDEYNTAMKSKPYLIAEREFYFLGEPVYDEAYKASEVMAYFCIVYLFYILLTKFMLFKKSLSARNDK